MHGYNFINGTKLHREWWKQQQQSERWSFLRHGCWGHLSEGLRERKESVSIVDENSIHQTKSKVMKLFTAYSCYLFHDFISPPNLYNVSMSLDKYFRSSFVSYVYSDASFLGEFMGKIFYDDSTFWCTHSSLWTDTND